MVNESLASRDVLMRVTVRCSGLLAVLVLSGCNARDGDGGIAATMDLSWSAPAETASGFRVPPPPLSDETFPCSDCHLPEIPAYTERRPMEMAHVEIELRHAEADRWCLDCHDADDRDQLRLVSGELIPFEESQRLCGQCHGDKYRDWRAGVHGRRSGEWNGDKEYLLCVHCHDSHDPTFRPIEPMPAPTPPRRTP